MRALRFQYYSDNYLILCHQLFPADFYNPANLEDLASRPDFCKEWWMMGHFLSFNSRNYSLWYFTWYLTPWTISELTPMAYSYINYISTACAWTAYQLHIFDVISVIGPLPTYSSLLVLTSLLRPPKYHSSVLFKFTSAMCKVLADNFPLTFEKRSMLLPKMGLRSIFHTAHLMPKYHLAFSHLITIFC